MRDGLTRAQLQSALVRDTISLGFSGGLRQMAGSSTSHYRRQVQHLEAVLDSKLKQVRSCCWSPAGA